MSHRNGGGAAAPSAPAKPHSEPEILFLEPGKLHVRLLGPLAQVLLHWLPALGNSQPHYEEQCPYCLTNPHFRLYTFASAQRFVRDRSSGVAFWRAEAVVVCMPKHLAAQLPSDSRELPGLVWELDRRDEGRKRVVATVRADLAKQLPAQPDPFDPWAVIERFYHCVYPADRRHGPSPATASHPLIRYPAPVLSPARPSGRVIRFAVRDRFRSAVFGAPQSQTVEAPLPAESAPPATNGNAAAAPEPLLPSCSDWQRFREEIRARLNGHASPNGRKGVPA